MPCSETVAPVSIEVCTVVVTAGVVVVIVRTPPDRSARAAIAGVCSPIRFGESATTLRTATRFMVLQVPAIRRCPHTVRKKRLRHISDTHKGNCRYTARFASINGNAAIHIRIERVGLVRSDR